MRKVYVFRDGKMVPKSEAHSTDLRRPVNLMSDLTPFVSPVDGSVVGSRSDRREHNRRNQVIDIGNERVNRKPYEPSGVRDDIRKAIALSEVRDG